jgi:ribosome-associated protein
VADYGRERHRERVEVQHLSIEQQTTIQGGGEKLDSLEMARRIVDEIADKKGDDILLLDIRDVSILADYFVIGSAVSKRQTKAMVDGILKTIKEDFATRPWRVEGEPESGWILMDYGDVVVHLFAPEARDYYDLEGFWSEARVVVRML